MTEKDWLTWDGLSNKMMEVLREKPGLGRKRRLLAVACCQRVMPWMPTECLPAVELAERLAEGPVDDAERWQIFVATGEAQDEQNDIRNSWAGYCACRAVEAPADYEQPQSWDEDAAGWVAQVAAQPASWINGEWNDEILAQQEREIADLIRDIFGNPFRPVEIPEAWLTAAVVTRATRIYEHQSFEQLPLLANDLEEAGCRDSTLLDHCRQGGIHVRGCWVLDAVLRKN